MGGSRKSTYETSGYVDDALSEMNPEFFIFEIHTTQVVKIFFLEFKMNGSDSLECVDPT